jgi:signal peptidase
MRSILTAVLTLFCLALAALMLVPAALGYHRYVIVSGSMTGTYDRGSIVYDRPVPVRSLKLGDAITYAPPLGAQADHRLLTHRIVWTGRDRSGDRAFRTRGDANPAPDPWRFVLNKPTQDRVAFSIPYAGYAFAALGLTWVRMLLLGLPALLLAVAILRGVWRRAGEEAARREAAIAAGA